MRDFEFSVNSNIENAELNELYRAAWPKHTNGDHIQVLARSLAYVCARQAGQLVGFVYVAWDGGQHAFLLDTTVHPSVQRKGIGAELVKEAARAARESGCEWLHVDYEEGLEPFYEAAGFRSTKAGLMRL